MRGLDVNDWQVALAGPDEALVVEPAPWTPRPADGAPSLAPALALARRATPVDDLWVAVPTHLAGAALPQLLRELRHAGHRVHGFVDSAVASAVLLAPAGDAIALDVGARSSLLRVVAREGDDCCLRREAVLPVGALDLHEAFLRALADSMVRQWRFDPLDDPAHEQQLQAALPRLLAQVRDAGMAALDLPVDGRAPLSVSVSRDQLAGAVQGRLAPLGDALRALCAASAAAQLWVPRAVAHWPGLEEVVLRAGAREVHGLAPGAAAVAASLMAPQAQVAGAAVPYFTRLPLSEREAPEGFVQPLQAAGPAQAGVAPTHLVFGGRALAIGEEGLVLGREPGTGPGTLQLPAGIAGLSRRHCTLRRVDGGTVLVDHSRFGSFVDGLRVDGRARLAAGSTLRLGTPGIELPLVVLDPGGGG